VLADHKINILPADFTINYPLGWSLSTYLDNTTTDPTAAFSALEQIVGWSSGYYNLTEIYYADSFWLSLAQEESYTPLAASDISAQSVQPGWNLYSNQAWIDIAKNNLSFLINGNLYSYQDLYTSGVCPYDIIGFRDGNYQNIDSIEVGEAFWFYFYPTVDLDNFYLANLNPDNHPLPDPAEEITSITVNYAEADFPIKVGFNAESENDMDSYDLPAPPPPPFNQREIFIPTDEANIYQGKLAVDYRQYNLNQEHYEWDFYVNHGEFDIINLDFEITPTIGYNYRLYWGVEIYDLSNISSLELTCFAEEISYGKLVIEQALGGEEEIVLTQELSCYPNPFLPGKSRGDFQLQFSLPTTQQVELSIYNIKGQLIKTVVQEKLAKGEHQYRWDGKDSNSKVVANGVYLIKLQSEDWQQSSKMLLLK
jgi:hypothetical protein